MFAFFTVSGYRVCRVNAFDEASSGPTNPLNIVPNIRAVVGAAAGAGTGGGAGAGGAACVCREATHDSHACR